MLKVLNGKLPNILLENYIRDEEFFTYGFH